MFLIWNGMVYSSNKCTGILTKKGGLPGAGVANIIKVNGFLKENGVIVYLASPDGPEDPVHKQYAEHNLFDDCVFVEVCLQFEHRTPVSFASRMLRTRIVANRDW